MATQTKIIDFILSSLLCTYLTFGQDTIDTRYRTIEFSGNITANTNGISPIPAFSLDMPAVIGNFSIGGMRLSFTPELAFSLKGRPWFISPRLTYKAIDGKRFEFDIATLYNFNFLYPEELIGNTVKTSTTIEHYALLQSTSSYTISEKVSMVLNTFHGRGLWSASIKNGNFFILGANITKLKITKEFYHSLFPQLVYIDLDGETQGLFAAVVYRIRHKEWPFFLSTQLTQSMGTNLSPNPGFNWNLGLTFNF